MGIFRQFPYTNFHDINLDWLLEKVQSLEDTMKDFIIDTKNTIVATVNQWLDDHPEATTTVQDHSLTNKKLVLGTLDFVTPEMFGAMGDGVTDDSLSLQEAIDYAIQNHVGLKAAKTYYITTGLSVKGYREEIDSQTRILHYGDRINLDFSNAKIIYDGIDYAFTVEMIHSGYFNVGTINAANGGGVYMHSYSVLNYINYLTIDGCEIYASASKDGILIFNEAGGWNNQNVIKNIRFTKGLYAIHFKNDSKNKINEWYIDNVGFEGVSNGMYMEAMTTSDTSKYIGYITVNRPRCVELMAEPDPGDPPRYLLTTYGRVMNVIIDISYLASTSLTESLFDFNYDGSGLSNSVHGTANIRVYSATKQLVINNNKIQINPYMFASACNIDSITDAVSEADTIYKNYYGTLAEFQALLPTLDIAQLASSRYANLNSEWLGGIPSDTGTSKQIVQRITTQEGVDFVRAVRSGGISNDWLMSPKVKTERKVLHNSTFHFPYSATGLLFIWNVGGSVIDIYTCRFGSNMTPVAILVSGAYPWTFAKTDQNTLEITRQDEPTAEYYISFVALA